LPTNRQIILVRTPKGVPALADFALREAPLPEMPAGGVLCRTRYLSLDPYMRSQIAGRHPSGTVAPGEAMRGETVSEILRSDSPELPEGRLVRCMGGWQEFSAHAAGEAWLLDEEISPPSYALSILGMTGLTAWAGLTKHVQLQAGQTLLLPAATGAVGCIAAGIAQHYGVRVVGVVGSEEKRTWALQALNLDACINRQHSDCEDQLKQFCPQGVNVYFDLVGGRWLHLAAEHLATGGHIILCGLMAEYNSKERSGGPAPGLILRARGHISGLVVYDYENSRDDFIRECSSLIEQGKIRFREDVTSGLEKAPAAFCRLMRGENFGKVLVRLTDS